jgi:hypothetical protein
MLSSSGFFSISLFLFESLLNLLFPQHCAVHLENVGGILLWTFCLFKFIEKFGSLWKKELPLFKGNFIEFELLKFLQMLKVELGEFLCTGLSISLKKIHRRFDI